MERKSRRGMRQWSRNIMRQSVRTSYCEQPRSRVRAVRRALQTQATMDGGQLRGNEGGMPVKQDQLLVIDWDEVERRKQVDGVPLI